MKKTVLAMVAGMLLVGPALAQNVKVGGEPQQRNTKMTTYKIMDIGSDGRPFEKEVVINENLPEERNNPTGDLKYSGVPCKFMRQSKAEKVEKKRAE